MEVPGEGGAPGEAVRAVDDTFILPYFLDEVQRQDLHSPSPLRSTYNRERRTLRPSTCNSFVGGICRPQERPLAAAVQRRRITSAAHSLGNGGAASGDSRGTLKHAEWLRTTLQSALKSSDTLPLLNHLRALTSRVFSEDRLFKTQASLTAKISLQQAKMGVPQLMQSLSAEEAIRLACRLAQENSYLETFVSTDARVLQSAALVKAQRERAEALESNRRLLQQAERDRQVIVELEMRSRAFADAYAWLTSHSRMIHAKDAPALVALWRKRVAGAAVAGNGPVVSDFSKNLAEAYVAADSEEDTEPSSEDGSEKKKREDRLIAAELREAEAVSEARQAQARAALAEARAAAAEQELSVARSQLARLTSAAASSAAAAAAAAAIPSPPTSPGGGRHEQLQAALRDSEERAAAAENECAQLKKTVETLQASLDLSVSEQHRLQHELAVAVGGAEAKLAAQIEQHAAERAQLQAQYSQEVEKVKASVHEGATLRRELEETRKRCADLSAQLAAAKQKGIGEGQTKAAFPGGLASPSTSDISTLTSERDSYKATALRLEMEIKRLSARAAEAAQLAEAVAALEEKLKAGEEIKRAYEALKKETQTLRSQLSERLSSPPALKDPAACNKQTDSTMMERDTLRREVEALQEQLSKLREEAKSVKTLETAPQMPSATGRDDSSNTETKRTAAEVEELMKERSSLQERVRALEAEVAALRGAARNPEKVLPVTKSVPSPTSSSPTSQPSPSKTPPAASPKGQGISVPVEKTQTAFPAVTREGDTVVQPSRATGSCVGKVPEGLALPKVPKGLLTAVPSPEGSPAALSEAKSGTKAPLPKKAGPPEGVKVLPAATPKIVAMTPTAVPSSQQHPQRPKWDAEAARLKNASPAVSKPLPTSPVQEAGTVPHAATSPDTPGEASLKERQAAAKAKDAAAVTLSKTQGPYLGKKVASPLLSKSAKGSYPVQGLNAAGTPLDSNPASSKTSEPPASKTSHGAVPVHDPKTPPTESAISGGDEASPSPSATALPQDTAAVKFSAASADGAKNAGAALPKTLAKATKVPAPPKKAPPVESPTVIEEVFSEEARQKLEKEVAELREQLAARDELKKAYQTLQKENENLQSKLNAVGALGKQAGPSSAGDKSSEKVEKAVSDGQQADVIAALEAQLSVLRPKAAAAEELEKDIKRLQGQLSAKEDLRKAHEALKKEAETLKEQLSELQSKARLPAEPVKPTAPGKGRSLGVGELEDALRKGSELRERVRGHDEEASAVSGSSTENATVPSTAKEAVASIGPRGPRSTKKPPPPPPLKRGQVVSAKPAVEALQAGDNVGQASTDDVGKEVISKTAVAEEAAGGRETGATEATVRGKCQQQTNGKPSVGKALMDLTAGKEPSTGEKAEVAGGPAEGLPKSAKKVPTPTPKPAEKATKVPPPPKKAPPVGATPIDGSEFTVEAKGNLEKEIARLREQLTASEELKKTHEALQKEFEALQGEFKALKAQAAAGMVEGNAKTAEVANSESHKIHLLLEERNSLRERVAVLESDLSAFRAAELQGVAIPTRKVAIPKTKGKLPPKVKPGMPPLPAKTAKQANAKAMEVQTADATGHRSNESHQNLAGAKPAHEDIGGEARPRSPPMTGTAGEGHQDKASLLTEEVLSKSDAETEEGDSGTETSPAEERIAELTERLHRAKRRVRNLVIKCNALVEMEKERDALRSRLESLQAKHEAISKLHGKEAGYKSAELQAKKLEGVNTLPKAASASALPASTFASTVADDVEGLSTMESGLATQSSSALLDVRPPADWAAKYEKLKAQRDKVYQAYKAQKERINSLEEEEAATKEKLERVERLYRETQEELEIATNPPKQREGTEPTGLLSWLGGGTHDEKNPEEQKLRARLELLQQRLQKAQAENEALSNKLAQMRTTPTGSPRGDKASGGEAATDESQKRGSKHLSPEATAKETGSAMPSAKTPSSQPPGPIGGEDSEGERKSLEELKMQIKQKDSQIDEYKAEILKLKASAVPASGTISVTSELAKKEQELQVKAAELEKFRNEALKMETLIKEKTEEVKTLQAKLEILEREKLQALSDNSALKKELETVQQELDALKAERSAPAPAKDKPKSRPSADPTSAPTKTFKRSSSLAKRTPGLPPPAPASRGDNLNAAAMGANEAREEEAQSVSSKPIQKVVTNPTGDQLGRQEERSEVQDGKEESSNNEGSGAETVSKRKPKKASGEAEGEPNSRKAQKEDNEGIKKKKKKKKKVEVSGETSAQHSGAESIADHEDVAGAAAATSSTPAWGFGLFGTGEGTPDASKKDATAKEAASSAPRPSILGLIVGTNPAEETPKEDEVPPLKLSTVDGTDDQSDGSSSDDGETDGGIASTIAGFFWGV